MALIPPGNNAGVSLPPLPANPPVLMDINNAEKYVDQLSETTKTGQGVPATGEELGAAESYKAAVIAAHQSHLAAPPLPGLVEKMQQMDGRIQQMGGQLQRLFERLDEMPILFANIQARNHGPFHNPTIMNNGWGPLLEHPNPTTREELFAFTAEQCVASAENLQLEALPNGTPVQVRRRQIASRLGVTID